MSSSIIKNNRKVLVGFKCNPSLKTELCSEANNLGITLSTHVETIVENQRSYHLEIANLNKQISVLNAKLSFYESPYLNKLFELSKGKTLSYVNDKGDRKEITIVTIQDVFELLIHSFKTVDQ